MTVQDEDYWLRRCETAETYMEYCKCKAEDARREALDNLPKVNVNLNKVFEKYKEIEAQMNRDKTVDLLIAVHPMRKSTEKETMELMRFIQEHPNER